MGSSVPAIERRVVPETSARWAEVVEILAVGPGALLLFPVAWALRTALGLDAAELAVGFLFFHLAHFVNDPHFAVTYLLFYRDARRRARDPAIALGQRVRYVLSGLLVPLLLVSLAAFALTQRSSQLLGWMAQLMYLLVGWHYAKQGFGVLMVLSARRGIRYSSVERNALLAHAYAAWGFAWAHPASDAGHFEEKGVVYWAPSRPPWLELVMGVALAITVLVLVVVLLRRWRALPWLPLVAYLVTLWLLTIFTSLDPLVRYAIPALHSVQYGYFVWLLRRNEGRAREEAPTFGRPTGTRLLVLGASAVVLGWLLFRGVPGALDALLVPGMQTTTEDLGATPFFAAFYVVVNLHHYFMDHAIWRREHEDTRWLYRDPPRDALMDPATPP